MQLYDTNLMTGRGMGKYTYKREVREEGEAFLRELLERFFPKNKIEYIV